MSTFQGVWSEDPRLGPLRVEFIVKNQDRIAEKDLGAMPVTTQRADPQPTAPGR
jgi:hypothetical protein